jgi:dolichol-phosphate mannosyltransferase
MQAHPPTGLGLCLKHAQAGLDALADRQARAERRLPAQAIATLVAMTSNFLLNNALTYRDRRLSGLGLLRGWLSFTFACSIGAIANVGVAGYLFRGEVSWVLSALAGILVGTVWNYAVTSSYTWKTAGR